MATSDARQGDRRAVGAPIATTPPVQAASLAAGAAQAAAAAFGEFFARH
jgi:hypothetical protein